MFPGEKNLSNVSAIVLKHVVAEATTGRLINHDK